MFSRVIPNYSAVQFKCVFSFHKRCLEFKHPHLPSNENLNQLVWSKLLWLYMKVLLSRTTT